MRTRMVPFSRVVPRLRRVVRQVGSTVGKQVQLHLGNVEGELDRSVLERIMAPLEHMLRNAIDHGIEDEATRRDLGKNPEGTISISFSRDGADILIRLADDGRGLDVEAIRAKAFSLGLMNEHTLYTDNEVVQFIFHPGFSTASEVTQTSGRGVGMDVVSSEVRQLGGSVGMTTQKGAGTEFLVRLPFTVSVNRALMIELGEDSYSLALNSISGVTRMTVEQLHRFYNNPDEQFEYGGEKYEVRYLGSLLSSDLRPTLDTALGQVPLVLTRIDNTNYAVQVDALIGSREIVVKSLGTQFSRVPGLSGATVLGDGRVVVILDLQGLLRAQSAAAMVVSSSAVVEEIARKPVVEAKEDYVQTVMVVDDSVTVRKVTSRFLEREGFRVITARDGVDAMRALQDITPDLMLLDIEMPRMDGFEVARLVRSTQRLKDLPIIMITSRTGDKHRERALAMGVNQYLGKPYQEDVLIREVYRLLTTAETA
jgi:chemosensory pili system protein ChpA (sensor histidine kinase/response regulator)